MYVFRGIVFVDDAASFERRKHIRQAFSVGLMAGRALRDV
jgi:hypothetical protein